MGIRRALAGDVGAIVRLWREMWDFHTPYDPRFSATPVADVAMTSWIKLHLETDRSIVLVSEGEAGLDGYLLGMVLENFPGLPATHYGRVSEIAVHRRREGVGSALLDEAHDWFRRQGIPYVEVDVSVRNPVAGAFWRKRGYGPFIERMRIEL